MQKPYDFGNETGGNRNFSVPLNFILIVVLLLVLLLLSKISPLNLI